MRGMYLGSQFGTSMFHIGGRIASLCLAAILLAGCGTRSDEDPNQSEVSADSIRMLEANAAVGKPIKVLLGPESRDTFFAPYQSPDREWKVAADGTVDLGQLLPPDRLSARATGAMVALRHGPEADRQATYVPFPENWDAAEIRNIRLDVAKGGDIPESVSGWARELASPEWSHEFEPVVVPDDAELRFALGIQAGPVPDGYPGIHFKVTASIGRKEKTVFQTLLNPAVASVRNTWHKYSASLDSIAGKKATFRFQFAPAKPLPENASPIVSAVWANPVIERVEHARTDERPNVLLISLDTLSARHLGAYGYEVPTSPRIDAFAKKAVLFENAIAPSTWTTPSHASMFTGLHPAVHGAGVGSKGYRLQPNWTTLAEIAYREGYRTAAFTEGAAIRAEMGFDQGFERYWESYGGQHHGTVEDTFARAEKWMFGHRNEPFFVFLHTYEPHVNYIAPPKYWRRFTETAPAEDMADSPFTYRDQMRHWYDAEIAYTDDVLGTLLDKLEAEGILENTLVIITSDHGEELFEHGGVGHIRNIYDEVLHVPLIIRTPGLAPARIPEIVTTTDIFPTVIDLLGWNAASPSGSHNLAPLLANDASRYRRELVHSQMHLFNQAYFHETGTRVEWVSDSIRRLDYKYMRTDRVWVDDQLKAGRVPTPDESHEYAEELIDLANDPGEARNALDDAGDVAENFRQLLNESLELLSLQRSALIDESTITNTMTPDQLEQLKALGYL